MEEQDKLPPLPPSDEASLERNQYNGFYQVGAKDFWGDNDINRNEPKTFGGCQHYFIQKPDGVMCTICHAGWTGALEARDGKLYINGQLVVG